LSLAVIECPDRHVGIEAIPDAVVVGGSSIAEFRWWHRWLRLASAVDEHANVVGAVPRCREEVGVLEVGIESLGQERCLFGRIPANDHGRSFPCATPEEEEVRAIGDSVPHGGSRIGDLRLPDRRFRLIEQGESNTRRVAVRRTREQGVALGGRPAEGPRVLLITLCPRGRPDHIPGCGVQQRNTLARYDMSRTRAGQPDLHRPR
jgi:hypothetical protein